MNKILGIVLIFAAAWLMFRLQAGSGSCCDNDDDKSDPELRQCCCEDLSKRDECEEEE